MTTECERKSIKKLWLAFILYTSLLVNFGYFIVWEEIKKIRTLIPEENVQAVAMRTLFLSLHIWSGDFNPLYNMNDAVAWFDCLRDDEALKEVQMFYVSYYIGSLALLMIYVAFIQTLLGAYWKSGAVLGFIPFFFGTAESFFIFYLLNQWLNEGLDGISEMQVMMCGCLGVMFWCLLAFALIITLVSCLSVLWKSCSCCTTDRQRGRKIVTIRELESNNTLYTKSTYEMMETKNLRNTIF